MNKKILITGGAGFIGHHIIEHFLKNTEWEIITMDRLGISGNYHRLTDINTWEMYKHRVKFIHHDLQSKVNTWLETEIGQVDYIFHLAASTHVDRSIENPMEFVLDNVVGTTNLLEFARKQKDLKAFLYFSTDEVFGPAPEGKAYKEWDRYNSGNPYAAAKAGGEEMCLAFSNTYGVPVIITHTMNVFGERQHPEKFIPICIRKILNNEKVLIHANKDRTKAGSRFWIHGRNVAGALLFLIKHFEKLPIDEKGKRIPLADKFNIVGEKEVDNLQIYKLIFKTICELFPNKEWKEDYELVDFHSSRPGHDLRYALDGSKMQDLGWDLPIMFEQSMKSMIAWTIKNDKWLSR